MQEKTSFTPFKISESSIEMSEGEITARLNSEEIWQKTLKDFLSNYEFIPKSGVERYSIVGQIASTSSSVIYKGWDRILEKHVAVKIARGQWGGG